MCEDANTMITSNLDSDVILTQESVEENKNQIRIYLIAQAKKELEQVMRMSATLDKMQTMYQEKALQYMADHDDETALAYLPGMIKTITDCLEISYNIINKVVGNEKIMTFQMIQNNVSDSTINIGSSQSSYTGTLEDPRSRERVRNVLAEIIKDVQAQEDKVKTQDAGSDANSDCEDCNDEHL